MSADRELDAKLAAAGIARCYTDGLGRQRQVAEPTLQRLLALLGAAVPAPPVAPAGRCHLPAPLAAGERWWGLGVQLYTLRSARNWGIGDFTDLAAIGRLAAAAGADFIAVNPLHARSLAQPDLCSPYSPSSRLFLDPLYIDPEATDDFSESESLRAGFAAGRERRAALRAREYIDYAGVCAEKLAALAALWGHFRGHHLDRDTPRARAFARFCAAAGPALAHYARFEAGRLAASDATDESVDTLTGLHCYLQWQADLQLAATAGSLRDSGMRIGLYRDLALGPDRRGAEAHDPAAGMLRAVSAGAPPDAFNPRGQCWNLAVCNPVELAARDGAPWAALLDANMRHAGALRIDHAMSLQRLFWILPRGAATAGTYVSYPWELLAGVLAQRSRSHRCLAVGEDLGTVTPGFRTALRRLGALGCRVLWFERDADGSFRPPPRWTQAAVVSATTHDLATVTGYWTGRDIALRQALGFYPDAAAHARALDERRHARQALAATLDTTGIGATELDEGSAPTGLCGEVHAHLARTAGQLLQVQLDDVLEVAEAINLPGTTDDQYPNWRRKLPLALEDLAADPRFAALRELSAARRVPVAGR